MQKKRESAAPARTGLPVLAVVCGAGLALGLMLLVGLVLALLTWGGALAEGAPSLVLSLCTGLCALIGGRFAVRQGGGGASMLLAAAVAGSVCAVLLLVRAATTGGLSFPPPFVGTLLMVLAGGGLAGLMGGGRRAKRRKRRS